MVISFLTLSLSGILLEAFYCEVHWTYRDPLHDLSVLLLCSFRPPYPFRPWWQFHEPRFPRDIGRKWNVAQQQRFVIYRRPDWTFYWLAYAEVHYYDTITLRHKETKVFLHSHIERYPLTYPDNRISSQGTSTALFLVRNINKPWPGQQVTGYGHDDTNNHWKIIPTKSLPETGRGRIVRHDDVIQLLHINTQSHLLTHDVASSLMPTNQEFTTWPKDDHSRHNDTLFQLSLNNGIDGDAVKTKSGHFRLVHVPTKVMLWTHTTPLPEWAFKQQEINGNKSPTEKSATWYADSIVFEGVSP